MVCINSKEPVGEQWLLTPLSSTSSSPIGCSLVIEYRPKAHVLKAWSPPWHYWKVVETLMDGTW
jgi:hypothetical protein